MHRKHRQKLKSCMRWHEERKGGECSVLITLLQVSQQTEPIAGELRDGSLSPDSALTKSKKESFSLILKLEGERLSLANPN